MSKKAKFKVGDTIISKETDECDGGTIKEVTEEAYFFTDGTFIWIDEQSLYQLVRTNFKVGDKIIDKSFPQKIFEVTEHINGGIAYVDENGERFTKYFDDDDWSDYELASESTVSKLDGFSNGYERKNTKSNSMTLWHETSELPKEEQWALFSHKEKWYHIGTICKDKSNGVFISNGTAAFRLDIFEKWIYISDILRVTTGTQIDNYERGFKHGKTHTIDNACNYLNDFRKKMFNYLADTDVTEMFIEDLKKYLNDN